MMAKPARILSLLPSTTEIVCALGLEERLVGRSHECDFPASVARLPVCTAPRFEAEGSSREIDERVRELARRAVSIYDVDAELLRKLQPDLIVTQSQCEVCAVSLADVEAAVAEDVGRDVGIVSMQGQTLSGIFDDIERVAAAAGVEQRGRTLRAELERRIDAIRDATSATSERPSLLAVEWLDPLMAAGNWIPELVDIAGGRCLFGERGEHSPWVEWDDIVAADPEVIVVMPCGFDIARARSELHLLTARERWNELRAVSEGRVFVTDANQFFNRPGPRIVESAEILAELLAPARFDFGHRGVGWQPI